MKQGTAYERLRKISKLDLEKGRDTVTALDVALSCFFYGACNFYELNFNHYSTECPTDNHTCTKVLTCEVELVVATEDGIRTGAPLGTASIKVSQECIETEEDREQYLSLLELAAVRSLIRKMKQAYL